MDFIEEEQFIIRNEEVIFSSIGNEVVIMDLNTDNYVNLDEIASDIWITIANRLTIKALCEILTAKYDISYDSCMKDVRKFLQDLSSRGWIKLE